MSKINESHLRPVLTTRRRWQYRRRKNRPIYLYYNSTSDGIQAKNQTRPRARIAPVRAISRMTSREKGGRYGLCP
nr:MAG TPA_asm: hypothetical protein [Caudoviricetes sp.]